MLQRLFGTGETRIGLVDVVYDGDGVIVGDGFQLLERHHPVVIHPLQTLVAALHVVKSQPAHRQQQHA